MAFNAPSSFKSNDSGYDSGALEVSEIRQATKHDQAQEIARQHQNMLAVELSKQVEEEYQHDILDHMLRIDVSGFANTVEEPVLITLTG